MKPSPFSLVVAALAALPLTLGCSGAPSTPPPAPGASSAKAGLAGPAGAVGPAGSGAQVHPGASAAPSAEGPGSGPGGAVAVVPDEFPRFVAPEGWVTEAVTNSMRLHQFRLAGDAGVGDVEVVVATWPNGVGGREDNLTRWATQVGVATIDPARRTESEVRHFRVTTVHLEGAYKPDQGKELGSGAAMLASFIEVPGDARVWTVKATGPAATVARWKSSYEAFIAGL